MCSAICMEMYNCALVHSFGFWNEQFCLQHCFYANMRDYAVVGRLKCQLVCRCVSVTVILRVYVRLFVNVYIGIPADRTCEAAAA